MQSCSKTFRVMKIMPTESSQIDDITLPIKLHKIGLHSLFVSLTTSVKLHHFFYLNYIQDILIKLSTTMVPTTATDVDRYKFFFINGIGLQCVVIIRKFCRKCMSCTQWRTSRFLLKRIYMTIKE